MSEMPTNSNVMGETTWTLTEKKWVEKLKWIPSEYNEMQTLTSIGHFEKQMVFEETTSKPFKF